MTSFFGNVIDDSALSGCVNQSCFNITATSTEQFNYMLTGTGGSASHVYSYGLKMGSTSGGDDILHISKSAPSYTGEDLQEGGTLIAGGGVHVPSSGVIYFEWSVSIGGDDQAHNSGGTDSYNVNDHLTSVPRVPRITEIDFGLEYQSTSVLRATWTWNKSNTANFTYKWEYYTNNWYVGETQNTTEKTCTYSIPDNAVSVRFSVIPNSTTYTQNSIPEGGSAEIAYWTCEYSTYKTFNVSDTPPSIPSTPSASIKNYKMTCSITGIDTAKTHTDHIEFQVVKDDATVFSSGTSSISTGDASYTCTVNPGSKYKVRARGIHGNMKSDWSAYSGDQNTPPSSPTEISNVKATASDTIYVDWPAVQNATGYKVEYATKLIYFDSGGNTTSISNTATHVVITGLAANQYFFRILATNETGDSGWSPIKSLTIGKAPNAPTTYSSTTTAMVGGDLYFYWIHNSSDGSSQTYAELEISVTSGGVTTTNTLTIQSTTDVNLKDKTSEYKYDISTLTEGAKITWRVRTSGVVEKNYGEWSVQRQVDVYLPATLSLTVTDNTGNDISVLTAFPFKLKALAGPSSQAPLGYHVSVKANTAYTTTDRIGNKLSISSGQEIFAKYYDTSSVLELMITASDVDFVNNISYTIEVTVSMNSGLTATASHVLTVFWTEQSYYPNAEIGIDSTTLSAYIRPYCQDDTGKLITGLTLGVYRREYDGSFTEISTGIENEKNTFVTDPHPSLDLARYRIVATETATGAVSYFDTAGVPTNEHGAILQWDEEWSNFNVENGNVQSIPPWSGSRLELLYNLDVSDDNSVDSSFVDYAGRKYSVSYYGTHIGSTSSWKMDVPKDDKETLYQLRRLAVWAGDVYVREPSGSGYWASVKVQFDLTHCEVLVPVTLSLTRVEGGI